MGTYMNLHVLGNGEQEQKREHGHAVSGRGAGGHVPCGKDSWGKWQGACYCYKVTAKSRKHGTRIFE